MDLVQKDNPDIASVALQAGGKLSVSGNVNENLFETGDFLRLQQPDRPRPANWRMGQS